MLRKFLGLLVIFVLFYLGAHFFLRWRHTVTDDVTKIGRLVECQPNEVRTITIDRGPEAGKLQFQRLDQPRPGIPAVVDLASWSWAASAPQAFAADATIMRRIASTLCETYDPPSIRSSDYHADTALPRLARRLEVSFAQGAPAAIEFGTMAIGTTEAHYVRGSESRWVMLPERFRLELSLAAEAYRNMRLMRTEADNTQSAALMIDGQERFTLERAGADWKLLLDARAQGDGSEEAGKFVNRATTLRGIEVEAENFLPADCAKMKAKATLTVRDTTGQVEEVRFDYGPKTDMSACSSLGSQKFRVHHDFAPFLDVTLKSLKATLAK